MGKRIVREKKTIAAMIAVYCSAKHLSSRGCLCPECDGLLQYALKRLDRCRFQDDKPTCANCPIHCYRQDMRDLVKRVMAYSGPRMMLRHPVLALCHLLDGRKKAGNAKG